MKKFDSRASIFSRWFPLFILLIFYLAIFFIIAGQRYDSSGDWVRAFVLGAMVLISAIYLAFWVFDFRPLLIIDEHGIYDRRIMHRVAAWSEIERIRERHNYLRLDAKATANWLGPKWPSLYWFPSKGWGFTEDIKFAGLDKTRHEIIAAIRQYMPVDD